METDPVKVLLEVAHETLNGRRNGLGAARALRILVEALGQVTKGEGRYSRDPMEHAANTIEDMQTIAQKALAAAAEEVKRG